MDIFAVKRDSKFEMPLHLVTWM